MTKAGQPSGPISAYMLFFMITSTQLGDPSQGFQRNIYIEAGHDAWICILLIGAAAMISNWFIVRTMGMYPHLDLYGIHEAVYGKWIGRFANLLYAIYLFLLCFTVLRSYIEVVLTWLMPDMPGWLFGLLLSLLLVYGVGGGIRTATGFSLISFLASIWLFLLYYFPWKYAEWDHLLPVLEADWQQIGRGTLASTYSMLGFELVYFVYPFVKDRKKVMRYSMLASMFTTLTLLSLMVNAIVFYSGPQLARMIWATLTMYKIAQFPFLERFELVAAAYWMLLIVPNCLLFLWAATRGLKSAIRLKQKYALYLGCIILTCSTLLMPTRDQIIHFSAWIGRAGVYMAFLYPLVLYMLIKLKNRRKGKEEAPHGVRQKV